MPVAVGLFPPAFSLCPQAPPGKKAWWNAKAGAAITVSIRAETSATAKIVFSLINWALPLLEATALHTHRRLCRMTSRVLRIRRGHEQTWKGSGPTV
jgi:hypothetical protein